MDKRFKSIPCQILAKMLSIFLRVKQDIRYILWKKKWDIPGIKMKQTKALIIEIISFLDKKLKNTDQREILNTLKNISLEKKNYNYQNPNTPPKENSLQKALKSIKSEPLIPLRKSILLALNISSSSCSS